MSQLDYYYDPSLVQEQQQLSVPYLPRPTYLPIPFILPVVLCGLSWASEGIPKLTDFGFLTLILLCGANLLLEFYNFPRRFGVGGVVLFGGVLVWFGYDYCKQWLGNSFDGIQVTPAWVVAKAAFYHTLMILMMTVGLYIPFGRQLERLLLKIPDPHSPKFYPILVFLLCLFGITPYIFFTAEPWYIGIYKDMFGGRVGGAAFTAGRSGTVNYSYGAYLAQVAQVGQMGGVLGAFYACLIARSISGKIFGWSMWTFYMMMGIGTGTRGQVALMAIPAMAFLFLEYQDQAAQLFRRFSFRAYFWCGVLALLSVAAVQYQITFRDTGYMNADVKGTKTEIEGNFMFSESLRGFQTVPAEHGFFYDNFPGQVWIWPLPDTIFWFFVSPCPRAIWNNKPVDPVWVWYNQTVAGTTSLESGTTVAQGLTGYWYMRFGTAGIIQGGLVLGFLMITFERVLQNAGGRMISILVSLALLTWIFRCFRGFNFIDVHGTLVGIAALLIVIKLARVFSGAPR